MRGVFDLKVYNADKAYRGTMLAAAPEDRQKESDAYNETLRVGPAHHWREPTLKDLLADPIIKAMMDADGVDSEALEAMLQGAIASRSR